MNTNPQATKILCFGDSNTWGQKPDKSGRYPANVRWTGILQDKLGSDYYVIEEGLGSRTTDLDYDRKPGRNGKLYLTPCVASHTPVEIVIIMLGTNDLKMEYGRTAEDIANAIKGLVADVRQYGQDKSGNQPEVVLVSPILINDKAPRFAEFYTGYYDENAMKESHRLADAISSIAQEQNCGFIDAATVAKPGEDGIHMDEESQTPLADLIRDLISQTAG
jgi:lysophospholipase L1-like esterase